MHNLNLYSRSVGVSRRLRKVKTRFYSLAEKFLLPAYGYPAPIQPIPSPISPLPNISPTPLPIPGQRQMFFFDLLYWTKNNK